MKEIRIVDFSVFGLRGAEEKLSTLVNQGWRIVAGGGGSGAWGGFVVLQREEDEALEPAPDPAQATRRLA